MEENYKVYIKTDNNGNVIAINSSVFLEDIEGWTYIDEGLGDKYAHAQGHYLEKGLITYDGIYQYKYVNGEVLERTEEEISADRELISTALSKETEINECKKHLADTDYVVIKIAEGVATPEEYSDVISQRREWRERINELQG